MTCRARPQNTTQLASAGGLGPRSLAYGAHLLPLAAMWGASYLFIEIEIEIEPATLVRIRLLLASAVLASLLVVQMGIGETRRGLRRLWLSALIPGLLNAAVPFTLISWGQARVDSGVAAVVVDDAH